MCICCIPMYGYSDKEVLDIGNWHYILVILVKNYVLLIQVIQYI